MHVNLVSRDKSLISDVLRISLPVIGEQLMGLAVGVVNTRLVGHLGAAALTAVSLSTQWVMLTNVLFATFAMGATTLVAQSVGADDWDTSNRTVHQVTLAGVAIGLAAAVLALLFAEPALALSEAEPEALALGATYLRITASIFTLSAVINMIAACLRGAGDTRAPMAVMTVVNLVTGLTRLRCPALRTVS